MLPKNRVPTHPGEILLEEFLNPLEITQVAFARHIGVPVQRINELVRGKRGITPETAWRPCGKASQEVRQAASASWLGALSHKPPNSLLRPTGWLARPWRPFRGMLLLIDNEYAGRSGPAPGLRPGPRQAHPAGSQYVMRHGGVP